MSFLSAAAGGNLLNLGGNLLGGYLSDRRNERAADEARYSQAMQSKKAIQ